MITFSEALDPTTVSSENFEFKLGGQVSTVVPEPQYIAESNAVRFSINGILQPGTRYSVEVSAAIQDLAGNRPDNASLVFFNTQIPQVVSVEPLAGDSLVVPGEAQIKAFYDAPIHADELDDIQLFREGRLEPLRNVPIYDEQTFSLLIEPAAGLKPGSRYEALLPGILSGPLGAQAQGDFRWSFQTRTPLLDSTLPTDGGEVAADANVLSAVFDIAIDTDAIAGSITAFKNGLPVDISDLNYNTEIRTLSFSISEGLRAGTAYQIRIAAAVGGPLRQSDYIFDFSTAIPLLQSSSPQADAVDVNVDFAELTLQFSAPVDAEQLNAANFALSQLGQIVELRPGDPVDRGGNVYGLAPVQGWSVGSRYEVQISPSVSGPLGPGQTQMLNFATDVPALISTFPAAGDTSIANMSATITARFDAAIDEDLLRQEGSLLLTQGGIAIATTAPAYDPATGTLSFNASEGLRPGNAYSVRITSDIGGPLQADDAVYQWDFATRVPSLTGTFPVRGDTSVADMAATITARFDAAIDEEVLRQEGGLVLTQGGIAIAITAPAYDAATGTLSFSASEGLHPGNAYSVRITSDIGGPLQANDAAYQWDFATRVPTVISTSPASATIADPGPQRLQVRFSAPVRRDLINGQNFRLRSNGVALALADDEFGYDAESFTASFPSVDLRSGTAYSASVSAQASGPLARSIDLSDSEWAFTTTIPQVRSTQPTADEDGVSLDATILQITFSAPVARQRADDFRISARSLADEQAAEELVTLTGFGADTTGTLISFAPEGGLKPFTEYRVTMAPQVLGELAGSSFSWTFRTAASLADARLGGNVRNASGSIEIYFPPNALPLTANEISIRRLTIDAAFKRVQNDARTQIAAAYSISAGDGALEKRATLTMTYTDEELAGRDAARLGIFRREDGQWQRIGGTVDASAKLVRTSIERLGTFALFEDLSATVGSLAIRQLDCQPRAFSPRGSSLRGETDISFDLTGPSDVTVRVYNSAGRLEKVIVRDQPMAPGRVSLKWAGLDEDERTVASGLYIVVVNAGGQRSEKTVAVVR